MSWGYLQATNRKKVQLIRALHWYAEQVRDGAVSRAALRGWRSAKSFRSSGGALNSKKTPWYEAEGAMALGEEPRSHAAGKL